VRRCIGQNCLVLTQPWPPIRQTARRISESGKGHLAFEVRNGAAGGEARATPSLNKPELGGVGDGGARTFLLSGDAEVFGRCLVNELLLPAKKFRLKQN
jgi:hypothetical protein